MPQSPNWKGWTGPYAMTRSQISEWDKKIALRVKESVERAAGKGLKAAVLFLAARIKEEVGLPAPRDRVPVPGGTFKYVARTKALRKAPPRKVSGALQRSVAGKMITPSKAVITVSAKSERDSPTRSGMRWVGQVSSTRDYIRS